MRLSESELNLQRTRPQKFETSLAIFQPQIALKCRINSPSISKGSISFNYNNVSFGSHLLVEPDMTLLIGTSEGSDDVGVIRLRSITASNIIVAENSDIPWVDQLYITVLRFVDIWAKFPRIIQNPSNETDVIFYKDYDIIHTNQNNILGTFISMGSHRYVEIENGTGSLYYSASGTSNLLGLAPTYQWTFQGGTPTGSTLKTPGFIRYNQSGDYLTKLVVTAPNGAVDTSYRYVTARDKLGQGSNPTLTKYEFKNLQGSRSEGGYSAEFTIRQPVSIRDGSVLILRGKDTYGATQQTLGGNYQGGEEIFFVGIVDGDTIEYDFEQSSVTFKVMSPSSLMKRTTGFSISVESVSNSNKWFQLKDMTVSKAIYHFLKWHTTILSSTDVEFRGTDLPIQFYDADRGSLFDSVDTLLRNALIGTACSDRQGKLWLEVEPRAYDNPTGSFSPPIMHITKRDWRGEPSINENIYDPTSYIEAGGIAYSGAVTGTFDAFLSGAPGSAPANRGQINTITGLAISSQTQLNQLSGNLWANEVAPFSNISIDGANMLKNLDIAPYEAVQIVVEASETSRNKKVEGLYLPESISWSYNSETQFLIANDIELKQLVTGRPGDTITILTTPEDGYDFPEFEIPGFDLDVNVPELIAYSPTFLDKVQISIKDRGIFYTNDFSNISPTWYPMIGGLPDVNNSTFFETSNTGRMYYQYKTQSIYVASQPGEVWVLLFNADDSTPYNPDLDDVGDPLEASFPRERRVDGFTIDRHADDDLSIFAGLIYTIFNTVTFFVWRGNSSEVNIVSTTQITNDMAGANRILFAHQLSDEWLISFYDSSNGSTSLVDFDGVETSHTVGDANDNSILTRSYVSEDVILNPMNPKISLDGGASWSNLIGAPTRYAQVSEDEFQSAITNGDGSLILFGTSQSGIIPGLVYSVNMGASWITGTFISGTNHVTAVWHIAEDSFILAPYNTTNLRSSILGINSLATSPQVLDKTGNLREVVTGTFYVTSIRHYWGT